MPNKQQLEGISVLVVEDNPDTRDVTEHVLLRYGATVLTADSATAALRIVERRKRLAIIPAAAVTAFTSAEDLRKSVAAGFRMHISKPFDIDDLITTVASLAGRATHVSPGDQAKATSNC
jgi:CheY-like chemotaxis protein